MYEQNELYKLSQVILVKDVFKINCILLHSLLKFEQEIIHLNKWKYKKNRRYRNGKNIYYG